MKKIIRILCLVLCLTAIVPGLVSCAAKDATYGAQINMYLTNEVYNFDPAYAHLDNSSVKVLGLLYEGIMKLDEDGDVKKALCDSWSYKEDKGLDAESTDDDTYTMTIKLKNSAWSDGIAVQADDFVYAWKRLLDPEFDGQGANLLYDIKGAWESKNEGKSPDDIGLKAEDKQILTIKFKHSINPDEFLRTLTSVALYPVRQSAVKAYFHWSSANTTIVTNGPFTLLSYAPGDGMELGRNTYYRFDAEDDENPNPNKYVKPYKILIDFKLNAEEMMSAYEDGELFYISELPASKEVREQWANKVKLTDSLCSHVYYFNVNKEPFNNVTVRQVLSAVIDRDEIVNEVVYAYASTGLIPSGIADKTKKDDFAENNTSKLTNAMSISEAKAKLAEAGIDPSKYSFTLTVKVNTESMVDEQNGTITIKPVSSSSDAIYDTVDYVTAKMVVAKWKELGFDVTINAVNTVAYQEAETSQITMMTQYRDTLVEALYGTHGKNPATPEEAEKGLKGDGFVVYLGTDSNTKEVLTQEIALERGQFDVIALDYQMLDTNAFSALSVFATEYSGARLNEEFENFERIYGHVTGYNSEEYNRLIKEADEARIAGNKALMSEKLHAAEALLLQDCPVIPIFVYRNAVLSSKSLSNFEVSEWGFPMFNKVKLKNWEAHLPTSGKEDDE